LVGAQAFLMGYLASAFQAVGPQSFMHTAMAMSVLQARQKQGGLSLNC